MRKEREFFKPRQEGVYLHVYNRTVTLGALELPFGDREKFMLRLIAEKFLVKYNIELISFVIMANHFHMLVYCPPEKMTPEAAVKGFMKLHKNKFKKALPIDDHRIQAVIENSNDISEFMREVQGEFTKWFNKSRPYERTGALWQSRFQSKLIASDAYLWACMRYLEMNPVRAGICKNAGDYSYSSLGTWSKKGNHPYEESFLKHIAKLAGNKVSLDDLKEALETEIEITSLSDKVKALRESGKFKEAEELANGPIKELQDKRFRSPAKIEMIVFTRRDMDKGYIIGSEEHIKEKYREWSRYKEPA